LFRLLRRRGIRGRRSVRNDLACEFGGAFQYRKLRQRAQQSDLREDQRRILLNSVRVNRKVRRIEFVIGGANETFRDRECPRDSPQSRVLDLRQLLRRRERFANFLQTQLKQIEIVQ